MSAVSDAVTDSATMLRRNLRHMLRYPSMTLLLAAAPVTVLLLFVYVFGGTLGAGLSAGAGVPPGGGLAGGAVGRAAYVGYVTPGILLMMVAVATTATSVSVATDMTEGIMARFRTMAISRASVLTGHVLGGLIQTMLAVTVVLVVAVLVGFRPAAGVLGWVAAAGVLAALTFALAWLSVAFGLVADSVETASNLPMFLTLLPFLGSGFVPLASLPSGLRWFAQYQPFTPATEALRGLLLGGPVAHDAIVTLIWSAAIASASYLWARRLFRRSPVR